WVLRGCPTARIRRSRVNQPSVEERDVVDPEIEERPLVDLKLTPDELRRLHGREGLPITLLLEVRELDLEQGPLRPELQGRPERGRACARAARIHPADAAVSIRVFVDDLESDLDRFVRTTPELDAGIARGIVSLLRVHLGARIQQVEPDARAPVGERRG